MSWPCVSACASASGSSRRKTRRAGRDRHDNIAGHDDGALRDGRAGDAPVGGGQNAALRIGFRERAVLGARGLQPRFGGARIRLHLVKPRLRDKAAVEQGLIAAEVSARAFGVGFGGGDAGAAGLRLKRETLIADHGDQLAAAHGIAFAHEKAR